MISGDEMLWMYVGNHGKHRTHGIPRKKTRNTASLTEKTVRKSCVLALRFGLRPRLKDYGDGRLRVCLEWFPGFLGRIS